MTHYAWIRVLLILSITFYWPSIKSQILPNERKTDWSLAGAKNVVINKTTLNILNYGGDSTSTSNNDSAINLAINALMPSGGTVYFPPGKYLFNHTIHIPPGIKIKGAGSLLTKLLFNNHGMGDCFIVQGNQAAQPDTIVGGYIKDSFILQVNDAMIYTKGEYLKIFEDDGGRIFSNWASNSIGQIVKIDSVNLQSHELILDQPLRQTYSANLYPRIVKLFPAQNVAFECFTIERLDYTNEQSSNIVFYSAINGYIFGIESYFEMV